MENWNSHAPSFQTGKPCAADWRPLAVPLDLTREEHSGYGARRGYSGQNGDMDLESATHELFGLLPTEFTAARNAKVAEARKAGLADVAASLKELRKPSVGAWLANLLVRERPKEIEGLLELGDGLRKPGRKRGGDEIRKVSKQRVDASAKLIRHAKSRASQLGHPASASAVEELEVMLDAAFADPQAAAELRQGRLITGLRYSGLGFGTQTDPGTPARGEGLRVRPGLLAGRSGWPPPRALAKARPGSPASRCASGEDEARGQGGCGRTHSTPVGRNSRRCDGPRTRTPARQPPPGSSPSGGSAVEDASGWPSSVGGSTAKDYRLDLWCTPHRKESRAEVDR